jgi:hypothetical protein
LRGEDDVDTENSDTNYEFICSYGNKEFEWMNSQSQMARCINYFSGDKNAKARNDILSKESRFLKVLKEIGNDEGGRNISNETKVHVCRLLKYMGDKSHIVNCVFLFFYHTHLNSKETKTQEVQYHLVVTIDRLLFKTIAQIMNYSYTSNKLTEFQRKLGVIYGKTSNKASPIMQLTNHFTELMDHCTNTESDGNYVLFLHQTDPNTIAKQQLIRLFKNLRFKSAPSVAALSSLSSSSLSSSSLSSSSLSSSSSGPKSYNGYIEAEIVKIIKSIANNEFDVEMIDFDGKPIDHNQEPIWKKYREYLLDGEDVEYKEYREYDYPLPLWDENKIEIFLEEIIKINESKLHNKELVTYETLVKEINNHKFIKRLLKCIQIKESEKTFLETSLYYIYDGLSSDKLRFTAHQNVGVNARLFSKKFNDNKDAIEMYQHTIQIPGYRGWKFPYMSAVFQHNRDNCLDNLLIVLNSWFEYIFKPYKEKGKETVDNISQFKVFPEKVKKAFETSKKNIEKKQNRYVSWEDVAKSLLPQKNESAHYEPTILNNYKTYVEQMVQIYHICREMSDIVPNVTAATTASQLDNSRETKRQKMTG